MKIIQGFVTIAQYVSNVTGITSPIGELSTYARTYNREKKEYIHASIPGYLLTTFKSTDTTTGLDIELQNDLALEILTVAQTIMSYASSHIRPYDLEDFYNTVAADLNLVVADLEFGDLISGPGVDVPTFAIWKSKAFDHSEVRVWFADQAFINQYTGFEIVVIPAHPVLNTFFLPFAQAKTALESHSISILGEEIQEAKQNDPETIVRLMEFDFVDQHDPANTFKTTWGILIYGKEGDYIDAIKDAIVDYLLANSPYSAVRWEQVLPGIFKRTEMLVIPRWDLVAVENLTNQSSLYSSVVPLVSAMSFLETAVSFYPAEHIQTNSYLVPYPYKALMVGIVNGFSNVPEKQDFKEIYPDYLPIPSTSLDFARMTIPTQSLILFLDDLFIWAEKVSLLTNLPNTLRRVTRSNKLFVAASHNGINFLVAAKINSDFN